MKKYRVYLKTEITRDFEAESEQDAIKWAMETPELGKASPPTATAICLLRDMKEGEDGDDEESHQEVIGKCELCGKVVLEDEEYSDLEILLCESCTEDSRKEFKERVANGKCGQCGMNPVMPRGQVCSDCREDC
jgi:hypothetical protein